MTTPPEIVLRSAQISAETEQTLRNFARIVLTSVPQGITLHEVDWRDESRWQRNADGNFRQTGPTRRLLPFRDDTWLHSLPDYNGCVSRLKSDEVIGPHLDHLVGTDMSATLLRADDILWQAIFAMFNENDGTYEFTDRRFDGKWQKMVSLFSAERIALKTIAPIPYLDIRGFPLSLNDELVLDRLTDDEVTRCCQIGVLQPAFPGFPLIEAQHAVGIRRTTFSPKTIRTGSEPVELPDQASEGNFGNRPHLRDDLAIDDVLSALRLFKHTDVRNSGYAKWTDAFWLSSSTTFRLLQQRPHGGRFELLETEIPQLVELWRLLEQGATHLGFGIHRFNLAFERGLLADRIVDLVIAAESLLLGDFGARDRGEMRFRFALRGAKFIQHPTYSERDVYRVMRRAYDARSAIVHGGSPDDTRLPGNESANLATFIGAIEELVRLGLRKALSMKERGNEIRKAEYWETLVLSEDGTQGSS